MTGSATGARSPVDAAAARGHVAPGFESMVPALERALAEHGEVGGALSAYVDGRKVVDLWCGTADGVPWAEDTLAVIFSCTKGALYLCVQILVDRGLVDLDAPVATYWPEYAAAGKQDTTVRQLLTHTAGVLTFPRYWEVVGRDCAGLADWDLVTRHLAAAPPSWPPGTQTAYHALSIGYLAGEVIRRVDGRSPGRFFAQEVAAPLGLELFIGAPEHVLPRVATILAPPPLDTVALSSEHTDLLALYRARREAARAAVLAGTGTEVEALPWSADFRHPDAPDDDAHVVDLMNSEGIRRAELPAGNGIATARDLARMYALLAGGGELDGVRLVSPESIALFNTPQAAAIPGAPAICVGYHRIAPAYAGPSATAFGHGGAGGSLAFADPQARVGFGFTKNRMSNEPGGAAADLVTALYSCLMRGDRE